MDKPSTRSPHQEDIKLADHYRHPHTLNDLPLYQVTRKTRHARRGRLNALVIGIFTMKRCGFHA